MENQPKLKERYFENEYVRMWLENGIIHIEHAPFVNITLDIAKINVAARLEIADGKTYPLFSDVTRAKSMTKEVRAYLSQGDAIKGVSAGAFLIKTHIEALIVNGWMRFNPPPVPLPMKVFSNREEALNWLEQFKRVN